MKVGKQKQKQKQMKTMEEIETGILEEMRVKRGAERKRTAKVMYPLTTEGKKQDRKGTANAGCLRGNGEEKWTRTP